MATVTHDQFGAAITHLNAALSKAGLRRERFIDVDDEVGWTVEFPSGSAGGGTFELIIRVQQDDTLTD